MANVLVGCEESQAVVKELRAKSHNAFSCDLQECSGGHPEWHIVGDLLEVMKGGTFITQSGEIVFIDKWKALIAFPPCTFISKAGARWMFPTAGNLCPERYSKGLRGKAFFMELWNSDIELKSLENPQPLKVLQMPKETQIIQPYQFGHPYSKRTFLWLQGFPQLIPTLMVDNHKPFIPSNTGGKKRGHKATIFHISQKDKSKTFTGIAKAMAQQWDYYLNQN